MCLAACSGSSHPFIGKWTAHGGPGPVYSFEDASAIEFDADGKGTSTFYHGKDPSYTTFTWADAGNGSIRIVVGSDAVEASPTVTGDQLFLKYNESGIEMVTKVYDRVKTP